MGNLVMQITGDEIKKAIELGRAAFAAGTRPIPGRDAALMDLIGNGPSTEARRVRSCGLMRAWLRGWNNVANEKAQAIK